MTLNWPANRTGWHLMYSTNLISNVWTEVPEIIINNAYEKQMNDLPSGNVFYKLVYS